MRGLARRLVGDEQLHHHAACVRCPFGGGFDLHASERQALARGCEHALALDLHHASAAVAVGAVARFGLVAEMRDLVALTLSNLPDGLALDCLDRHAVKFELDLLAHSAASFAGNSSGK